MEVEKEVMISGADVRPQPYKSLSCPTELTKGDGDKVGFHDLPDAGGLPLLQRQNTIDSFGDTSGEWPDERFSVSFDCPGLLDSPVDDCPQQRRVRLYNKPSQRGSQSQDVVSQDGTSFSLSEMTTMSSPVVHAVTPPEVGTVASSRPASAQPYPPPLRRRDHEPAVDDEGTGRAHEGCVDRNGSAAVFVSDLVQSHQPWPRKTPNARVARLSAPRLKAVPVDCGLNVGDATPPSPARGGEGRSPADESALLDMSLPEPEPTVVLAERLASGADGAAHNGDEDTMLEPSAASDSVILSEEFAATPDTIRTAHAPQQPPDTGPLKIGRVFMNEQSDAPADSVADGEPPPSPDQREPGRTERLSSHSAEGDTSQNEDDGNLQALAAAMPGRPVLPIGLAPSPLSSKAPIAPPEPVPIIMHSGSEMSALLPHESSLLLSQSMLLSQGSLRMAASEDPSPTSATPIYGHLLNFTFGDTASIMSRCTYTMGQFGTRQLDSSLFEGSDKSATHDQSLLSPLGVSVLSTGERTRTLNMTSKPPLPKERERDEKLPPTTLFSPLSTSPSESSSTTFAAKQPLPDQDESSSSFKVATPLSLFSSNSPTSEIPSRHSDNTVTLPKGSLFTPVELHTPAEEPSHGTLAGAFPNRPRSVEHRPSTQVFDVRTPTAPSGRFRRADSQWSTNSSPHLSPRSCRLGMSGKLSRNCTLERIHEDARERNFNRQAAIVQAFVLWRYSKYCVESLMCAHRAARRVAAAWRGHQARQRVRPRRAAVDAETTRRIAVERDLGQSLVVRVYWSPARRAQLATALQAAVRGFLARRQCQRAMRSVRLVQRRVRANRAKSALLASMRLGIAARKIQRVTRSMLAKVKYQELVCLERARVARAVVERAAAVTMQQAWRGKRSCMVAAARATAVAADVAARVVGEREVFTMKTNAWRTIGHVFAQFSANLQACRRSAAARAEIMARVERERMLDAAAVLLQAAAHGVLARSFISRRRQYAANAHSIFVIQTALRAHLHQRRYREALQRREAHDDTRVGTEQMDDMMHQVKVAAATCVIQRLYRGNKSRGEMVPARRRMWRVKQEQLERCRMGLLDNHNATAAAMCLQRWTRRALARRVVEKQRQAVITSLQARLLREYSHAAMSIQCRYRAWSRWQRNYFLPVLRISVWWIIQRKLRRRRHDKAARIVTHAIRLGTEQLQARRACRKVAFAWRCYVRRRHRMHSIRRWLLSIAIEEHVAAWRLQRLWRVQTHAGRERRCRTDIILEWMKGFCALGAQEEKALAHVPLSGRMLNGHLPKQILNHYLHGVARLWEKETAARDILKRVIAQVIDGEEAKARELRLRAHKKSNLFKLVETLRQNQQSPIAADMLGCSEQELDTLVWNRNCLPTQVCNTGVTPGHSACSYSPHVSPGGVAPPSVTPSLTCTPHTTRPNTPANPVDGCTPVPTPLPPSPPEGRRRRRYSAGTHRSVPRAAPCPPSRTRPAESAAPRHRRRDPAEYFVL